MAKTKDEIKTFVQNLVQSLGAQIKSINLVDDDDTGMSTIEIESPDSRMLIGRDGESLQALNSLLHRYCEKDLKEDDKIRIKSLYRKIVRKIHPDNFNLEVPSELKSWFNIIWQKVAKAHKEEDLEKLSVLHHKIVIALNEYDELGISDLNTAAISLESEYKALLAEYSSLKDSPAWNFSQLKDFKKLKSKLSKPFLRQQKELKEDLEDLKAQRAEIERVAGLIKAGKIKLRPLRKARRKTHGRRRVTENNSQMNFRMD